VSHHAEHRAAIEGVPLDPCREEKQPPVNGGIGDGAVLGRAVEILELVEQASPVAQAGGPQGLTLRQADIACNNAENYSLFAKAVLMKRRFPPPSSGMRR